MGYREEAIECVQNYVLPMQQELYKKHNGNFDKIYTEEFNNEFYTGKVIKSGREYELSYLKCTCEKVTSGKITNPNQCECSRQSILYVLSRLEPESSFEVTILESILRNSDKCTFRIVRK